MRDHPIPTVTEALQYRAIGVVRGIYKPEKPDQITRGILLTLDGAEIQAVVLGRVMTLMQRHLAMDKPHLWVVYPRSREAGALHLQIAGIWEPSTLDKSSGSNAESNNATESLDSKDQLPEGDDYFSVRGELVFTKPENNDFIIKVRQKQRSDRTRPVPFKLQIKGELTLEKLRHFLCLEVRRKGQELHLESFEVIGPMPTRAGKRHRDKSGNFRR